MTTDKSEVARSICADIKHICKAFGNRNAGSEGEKQTAEYFADRLTSCADEVKTETFKVNPNAFKGWIAVSVTSALMGIVAYFFSSAVAILLFLVSLIPIICEYYLYKRAFDPLFKEEQSVNVTAVKKCAGETKRRIYFTANMDAAYENGVKYRFGGIMLLAIIIFDFIGGFYYLAISIARWVLVGGVGASIASGYMLYVGLAGLVFVIPLFTSYFMNERKRVVDGANVNLSGCFVAVNAIQALKNVELQNTEVGVILTGSGACGLRGAKAWCTAHKDEVDAENTVFVSLSTLRELGSLNVNSSEMVFSVKSDKDAVKLVLEGANRAGLNCSNHKIPFGATDSAVFNQTGFKSAGIVAVNKQLPDYYNTRYDSYDNLSEECLAESYGLVLEIINAYSGEDVLQVAQSKGIISDDADNALPQSEENTAGETSGNELDNEQI